MKNNKWTLLALLCSIFVIYTIDRSLLGILAVPIQEETGLSNVKFGVLSAAIFWTYAIVVPFSGLAGDRFNRARLIGLAAFTWSAMTFLAGFAGGFWSLFALVSVAIVAPQTLYGPSANALLAECHVETRTVALSCHQAAYYTGWFLSGAAVAGIVGLFGSWRAAFFVCGSVGMVIGGVFLWLSRGATGRSAGRVMKGDGKPTFGQSLKAFFCCRTALLVAVCYVMEVFVAYGYSSWGPKFIAQKFSLSPAVAGTGVMFWHYASAFGAIIVAGVVTDRLVKRFPRFRMLLSACALLVSMPMLAIFGLSTNLVAVWCAAALLGAAIGVIGANQFTALFDVVPSECRSGAIGFLNVIAGLFGSLSPIVLGWMSGKYGIRGFELGFAGMAALQIVPVATLVVACLFTFRHDRVEG